MLIIPPGIREIYKGSLPGYEGLILLLICFIAVFFLFLQVLIYLVTLPVLRKISRRQNLVAAFVEILGLLEQEEGEDMLFRKLDQLMKYRFANRSSISRDTRAKLKLRDARIAAFTWVASPKKSLRLEEADETNETQENS